MTSLTRTILLLLLCPLLLLAGCTKAPRKTNWHPAFGETGKDPYSLYLTYNTLPLLFPQAKLEKVKSSYRLTNLGYQFRKNKGKSLLMLVGINAHFAADEVDSLLAYVEAGHQVLLSAANFDEALLERLRLRQDPENLEIDKKVQQIFLKDRNNNPQSYTYRTHDAGIYSRFSSRDTVSAPFFTLGLNEDRHPDCVVFSIGQGKLLLHAVPVAFSNHFLLQQRNYTYLSSLFSYIPENVSNIYFSSFNSREIEYSSWSVLWRNYSTRIALLLTLLLLGIFVLFEMKRRQKIIPVIPPVENASVAFVETIGRLYYNKKNHSNLAEKMVQHFLDFVRNHYYLNTNILDQDFIRHLAAKSGKSIAQADTLVHAIREVQGGAKADEAFLYSLYNQIQEFYHGK